MVVRVDPALLETMTDAELAETLAITAPTLARVAETIVNNPKSTIEPAQATSDAPGRRALAGLGDEAGARAITDALVIGKTIGEGGMGVVRLATQRSLARVVAVKTLRESLTSEAAALRLLREAWVTGALEHPNIVPIYDLGLDEHGAPVIVMKRIEGDAWSSIMHDPEVLAARFGATDPLDYNLRILVQLCNAVALAHARGILHRDLKPENVMVGRFGEVYLVDWGIAVSLKPDPSGRLPAASEALEMAGTPAYMAPEMLGGGTLSERTDVYLLGAVLHEILTGLPPHAGDSFRQIASSILLSSFELDASVPRELAEIARRAMSREPARRFASVDEMRGRLEWYLRHRGSLALSTEAYRRLDEMRALAGADALDDAARERLYRLFSEARFGFREALSACEDNAGARAGLREAITAIVRFELDRGTPEAAAAALADLDDPPPELTARVRAMTAEREAERARIERIRAELDPTTGRRTRMSVAVMVGIVWTVAPEVIQYLLRDRPSFRRELVYVVTGSVAVLAALLVRWGRESLWKTAVNRRIVAAGAIMFAGQLLLEVGANVLGLPVTIAVVMHFPLWFLTVAFAAAFVERRLWPSATGFLVAFLFAALHPEMVWHVLAVADFVLLLNFIAAWSKPREDAAYRNRRIRDAVEGLRSARK